MRDQFLLDPTVTFLNHGSFGACPAVVFEQYQQWQRELERQPVEFLGRRYGDLMDEALTALADYVGTSAANLVFVPNATTGLNTAVRGLPLHEGDEILTTDHEYGALRLMWTRLSEEHGLHIVEQPLPLPLVDEADVVETLWRAVTPKTRVLFLSHITSPTALLLPMAELCARAREAGILTVIDGAHVPGQRELNLDELGADVYSGNCHKWLCAPKGSAFLYVRPEHHDLVDPLVLGWGSDRETLRERTLWQGTRDIASFLSVPAAIRFQQEHDWAQVRQDAHDLAIDTMHRICELTGLAPIAMPRFFGQMSAAPLPEGTQAEALKRRLYDEYRVEVPITTQGERHFVRVSVQGYNRAEDTQALLEALTALL